MEVPEEKQKKTRSDRWRDLVGTTRIDNGLDTFLSVACAGIYFLCMCCSLLKGLLKWLSQVDNALTFAELVNTLVEFVLFGGLLVLWWAVAFGKHHKGETSQEERPWVHKMLTSNMYGGHNFLPGGFAPRIFSFVMGFLIFVDTTCIGMQQVAGGKLLQPAGSYKFYSWPDNIGCRPSSKVNADFRKHWFSRINVMDPTGCYGTNISCNSLHLEWLPKSLTTNCIRIPQKLNFFVKPGSDVPNVVHPFIVEDGFITDKIDVTKVCRYQCAKWKQVSCQAVLIKGGKIAVGGVFLERLTNAFTSRFGPSLVTRLSKPREVERAIDLTMQPMPGYTQHFSRLPSLLIVMLVLYLVTQAAPRIDIDGFYTIDYYVTSAFTLSLAMSFLYRMVHIRKGTPMVFTEQLWSTGVDEFRSLAHGSVHKVDLYEWYHLPARKRAKHLLHYARLIDPEEEPFFEEEPDNVGGKDQHQHEQKKVPNDIGGLKSQLLKLEESVKKLEEGHKATPAAARRNKHEVYVRCSKTYCVFSDVFTHQGRDGEVVESGTYKRRRIVIMRDAVGILKGKNHFNQLVVDWANNDKVEVLVGAGAKYERENQTADDGVEKILAAVDADHVIEDGDDWNELEDRIADYDD